MDPRRFKVSKDQLLGFASKLREARAAAGLSQERLAQWIGVSKDTVQSWEGARNEPQFRHLDELAEALGLDMSEVMGWLGIFLPPSPPPEPSALIDPFADVFSDTKPPNDKSK